MSLLIKALVNAEKDKQAELNKKQAGENVVDADLPLEFAPIDAKPTSEGKLTVEEAPLEKAETKSEFELTTDAFADNGFSLEEEAGLNAALLAANKNAKSKLGTAKAVDIAAEKITAQSSSLKGNLQEARHAAKPVNKVAAPVATATQLQSQAPKVAETNQTVAAKAFVANQQVKTPSSKSALVLLGVAGALMIWLGLQGYSYLRSLTAPTIVVVKPVMPAQPQVAEAIPAAPPAGLAASSQEPQVASGGGNEVAVNGNQDKNTNNQTATPNNKAAKQANVDESANLNEASSNDGLGANVNTIIAENEAPKKSRSKNLKNTSNESVADSEASLQNTPTHSSVQIVSKTPLAGVDPTLLAAYQAFNRGEDASAQQQYRQVLQRDVRNVDALLGMAAIAQRQGRDADAAGWYQKVLEIEPRNTIAQSAIVSPQANTDAVTTESRIKSMLAQQPEAANLYAALGNLYAEQNQWPSAQGAYFDASRFAPNNADYAFNLAISLDQLGKSSLALKQYQRALDLLNGSGATSPDRAQLEARIQSLR